MATHGKNGMDGSDRPPIGPDEPQARRGSFPGTAGDEWHRTLTGRQSPEPVSAKLRMIYGQVVAEELPDNLVALLAQLDEKLPKQ